MVRASMAVEAIGLPSASIVCQGFAVQGSSTAAGAGMSNLPLVAYPGHINLHTVDELQGNVRNILADQIVRGLTEQPEDEMLSTEPGHDDIVFEGTYEEVNAVFQEKGWSDGLPIVPPAVEKVREFLEYSDRPASQVVGALLPAGRQATIWSIAVNGVMAGCRPEYMPVLVAIVEAMVDPMFGHQHLGNSPGSEIQITLNGPIIKELGFNYRQGALRVGFQANTSIGRFWRLYLRNVAGFLLHKTDKGTFGGTWRVVLAENEDAVARIGWAPMSVDQGFKAGDNVVTVSSCTATDSPFNIASASVGTASAEQILDKLAARVTDVQLMLVLLCFRKVSTRPQILLSPCVAEAIASGGYSKDRMRRYLYQHARFPAKRFESLLPTFRFCEGVERGMPKLYCESSDPERMLPIVWSPDDFMITVSGDPDRDNCYIIGQNGYIGYPTSKKIELPSRWQELLNKRQSVRMGNNLSTLD